MVASEHLVLRGLAKKLANQGFRVWIKKIRERDLYGGMSNSSLLRALSPSGKVSITVRAYSRISVFRVTARITGSEYLSELVDELEELGFNIIEEEGVVRASMLSSENELLNMITAFLDTLEEYT